jgi:hypothetical protein
VSCHVFSSFGVTLIELRGVPSLNQHGYFNLLMLSTFNIRKFELGFHQATITRNNLAQCSDMV